ncbi:MAG: hypothetical protein JOZ73_13105 [Solirubrobacterales bacterium]|nr:hypothetical protein [Solirubrobacterales bacterium]
MRARGLVPRSAYTALLLYSVSACAALSLYGVALAPPATTAQTATPALAQAPTKHVLYDDGQSGRYLLGGTWLYRADRSNIGLRQGLWRGTSSTAGWRRVTIPNSFNAGDLSSSSWSGYVGWYRRDFKLPRGAFPSYVPGSDRHWIVRFESVNYRATVWLNGHLLGRHVALGVPFELQLRDLRRGINRLIVRVDNRRLGGDLSPGPGGGWWNYGGILREVYLRSAARADISRVQVRTVLPCSRCAARILAQVDVHNVTGATQKVRLQGSFGTSGLRFGQATLRPHGTWVASASVRVGHPRLWSPSHPALYRASFDLLDSSGRSLSRYSLHSGIRRIKIARDGRLTINGRAVSLRGVELREQDVRTGAALDQAQLRQIETRLAALHVTVIRGDPMNQQLEEFADRKGILIYADVPINTDNHVSEAHKLLAQDIMANQNHPSVLLWNVGDEIGTPADSKQAGYVASTVRFARRQDPTRPIAMAVADWPGVDCQPAWASLDVIGVNEYFGWYDAGGGTTDDRDALGPFLDSLRACYPHTALFVSEFGFDGARNGPVEERGTYAFQANAIAYHLGVFATKKWLAGAIYFLLSDSVSTPGYTGGDPFPLPPLLFKGLLGFNGNKKPGWNVAARIFGAERRLAK